MSKIIDVSLIQTALKCLCPRCKKGALFSSLWAFDFKSTCDACRLDFSQHDNADGPAVFIIFILGFSIIPLALIADALFTLSPWAHTLLWLPLMIIVTLGLLKPLKAYIFGLQFKYRPHDQDNAV